MIRFFFIAILFIIFSGEARSQEAVTVISGTVSGTDKGDVIFFSTHNRRDSAVVEDGRYTASIPFSAPGLVYMSHKMMLGANAIHMTPVYIEAPGAIEMDIDFSKGRPVNGMTISSPSLSMAYLAYIKKSLKDEYLAEQYLRLKYGKSFLTATEPNYDAYQQDMKFFQQKELINRLEDIVKAHSSTHLSTFLIDENIQTLPEDDVKRLYNHLSKKQRQSKTGRSIAEKLHSGSYSFAMKEEEMPPVNMPSEDEIRSGKLKFAVFGQINPLSEAAKVVFHYFTEAGGRQIEMADTVAVSDGKFTYNGSTAFPGPCNLILIKKGDSPSDPYYLRPEVLTFFLDAGNIYVKGETLRRATVEGSMAQKLHEELRSLQFPVSQKTGSLYRKLVASRENEANKNILVSQMEVTWDILDSVNTGFIRKHPDSYVSWQLFKDIWETQLGRNLLTSKHTYLNMLYNTMSPGVTGSYEAKKYLKELSKLATLKPGTAAPDFTMNNMAGKPVSLHALRGKYVLLDFWASWCVPCRRENPNVKNAYAAYKDKGLEVLAVTLDKDSAAWMEAVKKDDLPWLHVGDMKGWDTYAAVVYNVKAVPSNWLIDPDGIVVAVNLTGEALQKRLGELLGNK
ncbi:TlpA disulfide reductase family protein [Chitinophaga niabensis]|uniref:Peroxiredoxin n=1 Tax=Chitinophaga niabensis TaxID=536979 RepID=A0A1N6H344_9BACT|nr:TlpA disulfide reductase family protein [Chitinophaga niabensis]SIO14122.1 Peroxiredoxin [Chitinophaga niabensis]